MHITPKSDISECLVMAAVHPKNSQHSLEYEATGRIQWRKKKKEKNCAKVNKSEVSQDYRLSVIRDLWSNQPSLSLLVFKYSFKNSNNKIYWNTLRPYFVLWKCGILLIVIYEVIRAVLFEKWKVIGYWKL